MRPRTARAQGLILIQDVKQNITLANLREIARRGVVDANAEVKAATEYKTALNIKTPSLEQTVGNLSGGNQQKVSVAKWLFVKPEVLILDEPTRGIDVGAKFEIYTIMNRLVADGMSIIMISSELPEILGMSDRIYVISSREDHRRASRRGGDAGKAHAPGNALRRSIDDGERPDESPARRTSASTGCTSPCSSSWRSSRSPPRACSSPPATSRNLLNQTGYIAVLAVGMTLVIVIRHIDLSVGFLVGLPRRHRRDRPGVLARARIPRDPVRPRARDRGGSPHRPPGGAAGHPLLRRVPGRLADLPRRPSPGDAEDRHDRRSRIPFSTPSATATSPTSCRPKRFIPGVHKLTLAPRGARGHRVVHRRPVPHPPQQAGLQLRGAAEGHVRHQARVHLRAHRR